MSGDPSSGGQDVDEYNRTYYGVQAFQRRPFVSICSNKPGEFFVAEPLRLEAGTTRLCLACRSLPVFV